ncbi:MAG: type II secretion system F family protein [Desulfobacterales bacterium]|nr:type II secretion system F family protein [Desulfobacterales bacterium]
MESFIEIGIYLFIFVFVFILAVLAFDAFQRMLKKYEDRYVKEMSPSLEEMFIFMDPKKLFQLNLLITGISFLIGFAIFGNVLYALALGVIGFILPKLYIRRINKRRIEQFENQLADALNVLSNALRSGLTLVQAFETVENELYPPISQEFGLVLREHRVGVTFDEALENLTQRMPCEDLGLMVTAINIVHSLGGNLREIFDSIATLVTERHKLESKTKALTAQGRAQAIIVGLLPMILGIMMFLLDPQLMLPLITTTLGNVGIAAVLFLQTLGYLTIRKITTIEI